MNVFVFRPLRIPHDNVFNDWPAALLSRSPRYSRWRCTGSVRRSPDVPCGRTSCSDKLVEASRDGLSLLLSFLDCAQELPHDIRNRGHHDDDEDFRDADGWELHTRNIRK